MAVADKADCPLFEHAHARDVLVENSAQSEFYALLFLKRASALFSVGRVADGARIRNEVLAARKMLAGSSLWRRLRVETAVVVGAEVGDNDFGVRTKGVLQTRKPKRCKCFRPS